MEKIDQLVSEYKQTTTQIIYWDTASWQTNRFFVAVEGLFLVLVGNQLFLEFSKSGVTQWLPVALLASGALFNLVLCYVWFLINRRNREWLDVRIKRAKQIEQEPNIEFRIFALQNEEFKKLKIEQRGTSKLEQHIPTIFAIPWLLFLLGSIALHWV